MASDEEEQQQLLLLLASREAVEAKRAEVMRLVMLATAEGLASGEMVATDPELRAQAARAEEQGLAELRESAASVESYTRRAAEHAATLGGEAVAEAMRRQAASAAAMGARALEYVAFMRSVVAAGAGSSESESESPKVAAEVALRPAGARCRRRNAKYFGPEWAN